MAAEIARRIMREVVVELPLVKDRWKTILFGIVFQYVHGIFTQLAHRMHQPMQEPLHDIGFIVTPELGPDKHWVSETLFGTLFALFVLWTFSPFVLQRKRFYTVVMWSRLLMVLCMCQALRIITFSATQLPGPSFHCRAAEPTARRPWPQHWSGHLVIDVSRQMTKSCGDLIFSSHTTFVLTGTLAYTQYGSWVFMKAVAWFCAAVLSVLIIASRKHYTVDVVIAWYTVPLVFLLLYRRWTTRRPNNGPDTLQLTPNGTPDELLEGEETELQQVLVDKASNDGKFEKLSTAPAQQRSSMAQKLISAVGAEPNGNDASDVLPKLQLPNGGHRARNSSLHMFGEMEREDVRQDDRAVAAPNSMVQRSRAG